MLGGGWFGVRKRQKWCVKQRAREAEWASVRKHRL